MAQVIYSPDADADLMDVAEYIARDKPAAALR
jgi:plasmid stabilization system protein ParE